MNLNLISLWLLVCCINLFVYDHVQGIGWEDVKSLNPFKFNKKSSKKETPNDSERNKGAYDDGQYRWKETEKYDDGQYRWKDTNKYNDGSYQWTTDTPHQTSAPNNYESKDNAVLTEILSHLSKANSIPEMMNLLSSYADKNNIPIDHNKNLKDSNCMQICVDNPRAKQMIMIENEKILYGFKKSEKVTNNLQRYFKIQIQQEKSSQAINDYIYKLILQFYPNVSQNQMQIFRNGIQQILVEYHFDSGNVNYNELENRLLKYVENNVVYYEINYPSLDNQLIAIFQKRVDSQGRLQINENELNEFLQNAMFKSNIKWPEYVDQQYVFNVIYKIIMGQIRNGTLTIYNLQTEINNLLSRLTNEHQQSFQVSFSPGIDSRFSEIKNYSGNNEETYLRAKQPESFKDPRMTTESYKEWGGHQETKQHGISEDLGKENDPYSESGHQAYNEPRFSEDLGKANKTYSEWIHQEPKQPGISQDLGKLNEKYSQWEGHQESDQTGDSEDPGKINESYLPREGYQESNQTGVSGDFGKPNEKYSQWEGHQESNQTGNSEDFGKTNDKYSQWEGYQESNQTGVSGDFGKPYEKYSQWKGHQESNQPGNSEDPGKINESYSEWGGYQESNQTGVSGDFGKPYDKYSQWEGHQESNQTGDSEDFGKTNDKYSQWEGHQESNKTGDSEDPGKINESYSEWGGHQAVTVQPGQDDEQMSNDKGYKKEFPTNISKIDTPEEIKIDDRISGAVVKPQKILSETNLRGNEKENLMSRDEPAMHLETNASKILVAPIQSVSVEKNGIDIPWENLTASLKYSLSKEFKSINEENYQSKATYIAQKTMTMYPALNFVFSYNDFELIIKDQFRIAVREGYTDDQLLDYIVDEIKVRHKLGSTVQLDGKISNSTHADPVIEISWVEVERNLNRQFKSHTFSHLNETTLIENLVNITFESAPIIESYVTYETLYKKISVYVKDLISDGYTDFSKQEIQQQISGFMQGLIKYFSESMHYMIVFNITQNENTEDTEAMKKEISKEITSLIFEIGPKVIADNSEVLRQQIVLILSEYDIFCIVEVYDSSIKTNSQLICTAETLKSSVMSYTPPPFDIYFTSQCFRQCNYNDTEKNAAVWQNKIYELVSDYVIHKGFKSDFKALQAQSVNLTANSGYYFKVFVRDRATGQKKFVLTFPKRVLPNDRDDVTIKTGNRTIIFHTSISNIANKEIFNMEQINAGIKSIIEKHIKNGQNDIELMKEDIQKAISAVTADITVQISLRLKGELSLNKLVPIHYHGSKI